MQYTHDGTVETQSGLYVEGPAETGSTKYAYSNALRFCPSHRIFLFYVSIHKKYEQRIYYITRLLLYFVSSFYFLLIIHGDITLFPFYNLISRKHVLYILIK